MSTTITIMLDLKPPAEATFAALVAEWPTALSYAVSYLFIAIRNQIREIEVDQCHTLKSPPVSLRRRFRSDKREVGSSTLPRPIRLNEGPA